MVPECSNAFLAVWRHNPIRRKGKKQNKPIFSYEKTFFCEKFSKNLDVQSNTKKVNIDESEKFPSSQNPKGKLLQERKEFERPAEEDVEEEAKKVILWN